MMRNNSHSYKRGVTGFYPKLKSFWSCSHMNCSLKNILYINSHILYIVHIKTSCKTQELQESYQENKIDFWIIFFQFAFYLNFKLKLGFQVNP